MKFMILIICILFSLGLYANPTYKHSHQLYNFYVEIPAGTKQKWEINKDGYLEWEEKKGKKKNRKIFVLSRELWFYSSNYFAC